MSKAHQAQEVVNAFLEHIRRPEFIRLFGRDTEPEILFRLRCEPGLLEKCQEMLSVHTQLKPKKLKS